MPSLWNRSGLVERYADDIRAGGALAYFFEGGTTTPFTVYQDSGESSPHTHPVVADANGRWPDVFIPYIVSYDVRVTGPDDVQLTFSQEIPNPDPVEVSVTIPTVESIQTGMIHAEFVNTTKAGYVRLNGKTMGNASSGGTERAHADTEDLFIYLWNNLTNDLAAVSGGRGASGAADFAANKNIALIDCRGAALMGVDDMGSTAGGFYPFAVFEEGDDTVAGSRAGTNTSQIASINLPALLTGQVQAGSGTEVALSYSGVTGSALRTMPRSRLVTWYIKL